MSLVRRAFFVAVAFLATGSLAFADDLGFTAELEVGFGDVMSAPALELTPSIEWSGSLAVIDLTLHAEYTKSFAAGSGAGSALFSEEVAYTIGEDLAVTPALYNENAVSFEGDDFSGYLEPYVDVSAGPLYATVGLPLDYLPALSLGLYGTVGVSGESWAADVTVDMGITGGFSFDDVVLTGELTLSPITLSLSATVPFDFQSVTLEPELDFEIGAFTFCAGADLDLVAGADAALSPWVSLSFSF